MSSRNEALTLEDRLCKLADKINKEIGKGTNPDSGCSIYLYDYRRDKHVLPSRFHNGHNYIISGRIDWTQARQRRGGFAITRQRIWE